MSLVTLETLPPGLVRLRLCRPDKRNALSHELLHEAIGAIDTAEKDGAAVGILTAEGPVFCSGADLGDTGAPANPLTIIDLCERLLNSGIYWIAAIQGPALGAGVALASVCPATLARRGTWLSLPEISLGMFPAVVVAYVEPRLGTKLAVQWGLAGTRFDADSADMRPLITRVLDDEKFEEQVAEYAEGLTLTGTPAAMARRAWQSGFNSEQAKQRRLELFELMDKTGAEVSK
jgi:enoyl-CoA hydratase/carnithine racemase